MYANRRLTLPTLGMVCDAIKAAFQGTVALVLDRVPDAPSDGGRGNTMVYPNPSCKPGHHNRGCVGLRDSGCGRDGRVYHIGDSGIAQPCHLPYREGAPIVLPSSRNQVVERGENVAGDRHKGRRRVRRSAAQRSPKRKKVHVVRWCIVCREFAALSDFSVCSNLSCIDIAAKAGKLDFRRTKGTKRGKP